ncbi:MAG TPA: response regulator [Calditrichia bacterium]|nr:response regulator [Calditrichota bacterium]HQU71560.1 response regulator [Calditrichia bacterium]HQV31164.1 response regulator [Calditrichia bacterium]
MEKPIIVCVDDQREVLASLRRDLDSFEPYCLIETCESADEVREVLADAQNMAHPVALLICDHIMPEETGIDLLISLSRDGEWPHTKKMLLTGLATHQDTITAINQAGIDRYVEKPWDSEILNRVVRSLLTGFLMESGADYQPFLPILDQEVLYQALHK